MISVDALLFDLDGTLIDSKKDLALSVQQLQRRYRVSVNSESEIGAFIGDGVVKLVQRALPRLPERDWDEAVSAFKHFYRRHCLDHTKLYPGVRTVLQHFKGKKMAVVTNKPVRISAHLLDALGVSSSFQVLIGGDSLPQKKPHPEPVVSALKTLGLGRSKRAVMVGDGPNDVAAGRAAGIFTCAIRSNIGDPKKLRQSEPDFWLKRIADLPHHFY